jgi:hypothetical protein
VANDLPQPDSTRPPKWEELGALGDTDLVRELIRGNHDTFAVIADSYHWLIFSVALCVPRRTE